MAQTLVMYPHPEDPAAFDKYYAEVHTPLALKIPGLRSLVVNKGPISTPAGPSSFHVIAELTYDSMEALQAAMASPEAQATVADLANFAPADTQVYIFETDRK